jgi:hypothetical protein
MNDVPGGYPYPPEVHFEVRDKHLPDYQLAADFLNVNQVNVVCLQHEFGIFGGAHGSHILMLLRHLHMPIITTLHTVLIDPDPGQRAVLKEIADLSERLVVMSHKAEYMLQDVYGISAEKIAMIPHGIPDAPFIDPNFYKDQFAAAAPGREQDRRRRVTETLQAVSDLLAQHISAAEAPAGLLAEIDTLRPTSLQRVKRLRQEHADLLQQTKALRQRLADYGDEETPDFQDIRQRATWLLNALRHHQATETDLIFESFWTDIGTVD